MSRAGPRRIRVARPGTRFSRAPVPAPGTPLEQPVFGMRPNAAGLSRGVRQFELFSGLTLLLLAAFFAVNELSPYVGARENGATLGTLATGALLVIAYAYLATLRRAPKSAQESGGSWNVLERVGRLRTFTIDAAKNPVSLRIHPPDLFCGQWTETVELQLDLARTRVYLLERGLRPGSDRLPTTLAEGT